MNSTQKKMYILHLILNAPFLCEVVEKTPSLDNENFDCMVEQITAEHYTKRKKKWKKYKTTTFGSQEVAQSV